MAKRKVASLGWVASPFWCFLLCWIVLIVLTLDHPVSGGTTTARLDLSYLHRCGETDMASAIRGTLKEQTKSSDQADFVDIDLTASLIGKNISDILSSLQNDENDDDENDDDESVPVKLTARRNHLSHAKATALVEFVLQNGPTNETTTTEMDAAKGDEESPNDTEPEADPESTSPATEDTTSAKTITNGESKNTETITEETATEITTEPTTETETTTTTTRIRPAFVSVQSLDLGWNNFGSSSTSGSGVRALNGALRRLLADPERCPPFIRLDVCGFGPQACRDLAKGIVERYKTTKEVTPLSLNLACNEGIGDVGVAALAAAIRTVAAQPEKEPKKKRRKKRKASKQQQQSPEEDTKIEEELVEEENNSKEVESPLQEAITILERLDLSGCGIGDAGAEALAIALKNNPLCVKHLDLSNNQITDQGAAALAQALGALEKEKTAGFVETLDLSHNPKLGDAGAKSLAQAFQRDGISRLILRSCNVRADGAACFGSTLKVLGSRSDVATFPRLIDLSGNPLGILSKTKKSGNKYSATALRSKATDTANAYMNIIGKSFQKGLNSINGGMDTLESDDEEEAELEAEEEDESRKKCGALSLAEAFIRDGNEEKKTLGEHPSISVELGLRHCAFDTRAAEALAAVLYEAKEEYPRMKLSMDMTMNHVLEDDIIAALHGEDDDQLADMAEVYLDALEVMREARQRALEASRMAASRVKAQAERESAWAAPPPSYSDDWEEEDGWDYERNIEEDYSEEDW